MHRRNQLTSCSLTRRPRAAILLVSADVRWRDTLSNSLRDAGYDMAVATDAGAARHLLRDRAFDLVLLDGVMPGADACKVADEIWMEQPAATPPLVLIAGRDGAADAARSFAAGDCVYVSDPSEIALLTTEIETRLAERRIARTPLPSHDIAGLPGAGKVTALQAINGGRPTDGDVLTDALDAIDEGIVLWDSEDRLVVCNASYRKLFGADAEHVVPGVRFEELMQRQLQSGALRTTLARPQAWLEKRLRQHRNPAGPLEEEYADGTWVRVSETRTDEGCTVGLYTEISQVKRREIALKTSAESNRRLAAAVNAAESTILITDPNRPGNPTVFANPAFTGMTGWPVEEALGRDRSFLHGPDTDSDNAGRFEGELLAGRPASAELRLNARNGRCFWANVNASPIRGNDGRIANWVIILTDITARKEAEERRDHRPQAESIGPLTAGLAHDLNNLLTIALNHLEGAIAPAQSGDSQTTGHLEAALAATRRSAEATRRLLTASREQTTAFRITDPGGILTSLVRLVGHSLGEPYRLQLAETGDLWPVAVDPGAMENAVLNLVFNGRDSMPAGGTVTLEAANTALKNATDVTGRQIADGDYVCVSVRDQGEGMAPDIIAKAIQPHFTTKPTGKGIGLGLSTVHAFMAQSGGAMQIDSRPGRGTTMSLFFPRAATVGSVDRARPVAGTGGSESILLVDDEPELRAVTAMQLSRLGYHVLQAGSAEAALDIAERDGPFDLLITDIALSGDSTGHQLVAALRARQPQARVMLVSGLGDGTPPEGGPCDRSVGFLAKPYDGATLASAVRRALAGDRLTDGSGFDTELVHPD